MAGAPGTAARPRLNRAAALSAPAPGALAPTYRLHFDPTAKVFPDSQAHEAHLSLAPAYTVADVPVNWTGDGVAPPNPAPAYRLVVMLVADNAIPPAPITIADTHRPDVSRNPRADTPADTSFNQLVEGLLRWSLDAYGITDPTASVTLVDLVDLAAQLALVEAADQGFTWANLEGFFTNNVHVVVSGTPSGSGAEAVAGTPFPMIPALRWASPDLPVTGQRTRDFGTYQPIDATYEAGALAYFAKLDPRPPADQPVAAGPSEDDPVESMATFILRDYAHLIARTAVDAAVDLLTSYPLQLVEAGSLGTIGRAHGVDPVDIALANPGWPVVPGATVHLGTLTVQVAAGATIASLAETYGLDGPTLVSALDATTPLLRVGATLPLPGLRLTGLPLEVTAAVFFVRLGMTRPEDVALADWYGAAIERLNPPASSSSELVVPTGYQQTTTTTWPMLPGDTVPDVAAYLALVQNVVTGSPFASWLAAVRAANPTPGADVALPSDAVAVILPNDTPARLRTRLLLGREPFAGYIVPADVLVPLVTVDLPGASIAAPAAMTLLTLAQSFDLGLEDLARRIAEDLVLAPQDGSFRVPGVPEMSLVDLVAQLHAGKPMATISGQVSRFLLSGLRLPEPVLSGGRYHATGAMTGLYELTGQQVSGPLPTTAPSVEPVVTITVDKDPRADWLSFAAAEVRDGMLTDADPADHAVISITAADLAAGYPATGLAPKVVTPLAPLALSHDVGVRYGLAQMIPWQTTEGPVLPVPAPAGATPSLWPLPADLMARAARGVSPSAFTLEQTTPQTGVGASITEVGSSSWGTLIAFDVRRIPGLPGTVEVFGAASADRQRLAQVLERLAPVGDGRLADLRLLWRLPPAPGWRPGLTSVALDLDATFIVQTNLSTETHPGVGAMVDGPVLHSAPMADAVGFLTLLWECSVVGGGGYWMQVRGLTTDVPESIFDQDGRASLSLLIQLVEQPTVPPDRHLHVHDNVAVVGDGIDPASVALMARAVKPPERTPVAAVAPGQLGFAAEYANPSLDATPQGRLCRLYGQLGFQLTRTDGFEGSDEGRPIDPKAPNGHDDLGVAVYAEDDETVWRLSRVVNISRFARQHRTAPPTAPAPEDDPYAGIALDAAAEVAVRFQDVFGNTSGTPTTVVMPVRYTDPLLGPGSWPSTTTSYTVSSVGDTAHVVVTVDLQTVAYQPAASDPASVVAAVAGRDRSRMAAAWYQVVQPDVRTALLSSLRQAPDSEPTPLPVDIEPLRHHVLGTHALLGSIASIEDAFAPGGAAIDEVIEAYGLDHDTLAAANTEGVLGTILGASSLAVPVTVAFRNDDSVTSVCASIDPPPSPEVVLQDEDNVVLPLNPGIELVTPSRVIEVGQGAPTANDVAEAGQCRLATLVAANAATPGLLTPGFIFTCNGVKVGVLQDLPASETTLALVAQTFAEHGVPYDTATIVALNADGPGMFRAGASLRVEGYLVVSGDTLEANGSGHGPADLAPRNTHVTNLFPPGTPLFLTTRSVSIPADVTLTEFAMTNRTAPGAPLRHNGAVPVSVISPPVVPGTWAWPADPATLLVPYTVQPGAALATMARHFDGADARTIVLANADMPSTVAAGVTLTVAGTHVTTTATSSFAEVRDLFSPAISLGELADALAPRPDVLAPGALLLCPRGALTIGTSSAAEGLTPGDAARPYGVTPVALLAANAGTPDLLLAGAALAAWTPTAGASAPVETIAAHDTLTAVIQRFHRRGIATNIETVVAANVSVPLLRVGAFVLVPPATTRLAAPVGEDGDFTFPAAVFPLHVTLELARDPALVDPALTSTATHALTTIPAARPANDTEAGTRSLAAFADTLQAAVPVLRVATGQALGADTDIWAVVFGPGGIAEVSMAPPVVSGNPLHGPQPRTFALRPLATTLVARSKVVTRQLDLATGELSPDGAPRDFQGIDLEVWARTVLVDLELLLSAPYARGAFTLDRAALDRIVRAKHALAGAVAEGLDYVLAGEAPAAPGSDPKRSAAIETLRQQLLESLVRGYDTDAVIQYDTLIDSPWTSTYARVVGNPVVTSNAADAATATVSSGKVSLTSGASQVSFLVDVPDLHAHAGIDLSLELEVGELEFNIEPMPQAEGYERSEWLTFVSSVRSVPAPVLHFELGSPRIPVPIRAYPPMPMLVGHEAIAPKEPTELDAAVRWQYELSLQHQSAEQDRVAFRVRYNTGTPEVVAITDGDDLFAALAQYVTVATPLLGLLSGIVDQEGNAEGDPHTLRNALETFAVLVEDVGVAWQKHWDRTPVPTPAARPGRPGPTPEEYEYALHLQADGDDQWYTALRLELTGTVGSGDVAWPEEVVCVTPSGDEYVLMSVVNGACDCPNHATCRCYEFPPESVLAFSLLTFSFRFPSVHVASHQDATAQVWATRNAKLLGDGWPLTTPAFVYRTPEVGNPRPVVPLIDVTSAISIGAWPTGPLPAVFDEIFDHDSPGRLISVGVRYGYTLIAGERPVEALLPVVQSTVGVYAEATVEAISTRLTEWLGAPGAPGPVRDGGAWTFWVRLYSSLDPTLQRPVLQLRRLRSELA